MAFLSAMLKNNNNKYLKPVLQSKRLLRSASVLREYWDQLLLCKICSCLIYHKQSFCIMVEWIFINLFSRACAGRDFLRYVFCVCVYVCVYTPVAHSCMLVHAWEFFLYIHSKCIHTINMFYIFFLFQPLNHCHHQMIMRMKIRKQFPFALMILQV